MERKTMTTMNAMMTLLMAVLITFSGCKKDSEITTDTNNELPGIADYPIVGTNQTTYYGSQNEITAPTAGESFYGQNAYYLGNTPSVSLHPNLDRLV
ncbi:MAG: hypothetical protein CL661_07875 [Bacteroidetes bacterium]|nr:hypothetical protein [Bacteroidota bacterium]|tara:strand:+ start:830 stop:1120 length:291 start_codon:yes stop_codon:yes gene_type:complete